MHDPKSILATARRVVGTEITALQQLEESLDGTVIEAVETILKARGRVIMSGMGKSGHIARKIAATFASTGTPAHFVHPAEASHGDLGMMARGDVVMVLSNSGETPELANLVAYTRRFEIPLIGVASVPGSSLLTHCDIALTLPQANEACGMGIVPTSSTTMTLALGDAIAIALMEARAFTPENFREFHPGGKLGARLSRVRDLMHQGTRLPLVTADQSVREALIEISKKGFGVAAVINDEHNIVGIITDGDLRRHIDQLMSAQVKDIMTEKPIIIAQDELAERAVAIMNTHKITSIFVTETGNGGMPTGLLHIHDCLRAGLV